MGRWEGVKASAITTSGAFAHRTVEGSPGANEKSPGNAERGGSSAESGLDPSHSNEANDSVSCRPRWRQRFSVFFSTPATSPRSPATVDGQEAACHVARRVASEQDRCTLYLLHETPTLQSHRTNDKLLRLLIFRDGYVHRS